VLSFEVGDTGIGIAPEDQHKLFRPFEQLDVRKNRNVVGTGLGLSITYRLCQMMGGTITVRSEYGAGSVFTALIPWQPAEGNVDVIETAGSRMFTAPQALVLAVDDIEMNLAVFKALVDPYRIQVESCLSGMESVKLAAEKKYDVIFMDHMMPGMDGIEAAHLILKNNRTVPIVALTANAIGGMREMFMANGFSDFIAKPINPRELEEALNKWIPDEKKQLEGDESGADKSEGESAAETGTVLKTFSVIPGLDVAAGIRQLGDEESWVSVVEIWRDDARDRLSFFEKPPTEETLKDWTIQAHAMKGASATIGAAGLGEQAKELEFAGRAGDMALIKSKIQAFYRGLSAMIDAVSGALDAYNS
jgi:CheY-like chemotaxis protein/HPt (histidine-containing phosphotransfer) domain-containing protein